MRCLGCLSGRVVVGVSCVHRLGGGWIGLAKRSVDWDTVLRQTTGEMYASSDYHRVRIIYDSRAKPLQMLLCGKGWRKD